MPKNYLIYNKNCPFCKRTAEWLKRLAGRNLIIIANCDKKKLGKVCKMIKFYDIEKDVHFIQEEKGSFRIYHSGEAVAGSLGTIKRFSFMPRLYKIWPFGAIIEVAYKALKKIKSYL